MLGRLNGEDGVIVSGGVDVDNKPLDSVEFFSIPQQASGLPLIQYIICNILNKYVIQADGSVYPHVICMPSCWFDLDKIPDLEVPTWYFKIWNLPTHIYLGLILILRLKSCY